MLARVLGLEPRPKVLETFVLPLNYTRVYFGLQMYGIFINLTNQKAKIVPRKEMFRYEV